MGQDIANDVVAAMVTVVGIENATVVVAVEAIATEAAVVDPIIMEAEAVAVVMVVEVVGITGRHRMKVTMVAPLLVVRKVIATIVEEEGMEDSVVDLVQDHVNVEEVDMEVIDIEAAVEEVAMVVIVVVVVVVVVAGGKFSILQ